MTIKYKSPYGVLELTSDDLLWLARMCYGEGGARCSAEHAAVQIYAMLNRYLLHPGKKHWPTFTKMLRLFSQPINPRWMRGGDLAKKNKGKPSCSKARLDRRERVCALTWEEIPLPIQYAVEAAKVGELERYLEVLDKVKKKRLSNWAAATLWMKVRYPQGINIDGNWFLEDKELKSGLVTTQDGNVPEGPGARMQDYFEKAIATLDIDIDEQTSAAIEVALSAVAKEITRPTTVEVRLKDGATERLFD